MPRTARMVIKNEPAVYHVVSRMALDGFPLGSVEKDYLLKVIKSLSNLYFSEIYGFCIMGNHLHILLKMLPDTACYDEDIETRLQRYYGPDYKVPEGRLPHFRLKLSNLSEFMRDLKVNFARYYNRRHNRRGYFWGDRFKSVIVDKGETLVNCLAYIDLNPLRAGIVSEPEKYRWNAIGYHLQTNNKDSFLSTDFGLKEFNVPDSKERIRRYRRYMYEAGAIDRQDKGKIKVIDPRVLAAQKKKDFEISIASRLRYRTRYFTDSGIIGSKQFVATNYQRFKQLFASRHEKIPKPVNGLCGIYSLKNLSESI
jgi:putative transposase